MTFPVNSAVSGRFSVIALCQRSARNLERILLVSSDWRNEVRQQEIFRADRSAIAPRSVAVL